MFTLPDLPYAYNSLEPYIDEATMKVHHDGHHAAYVNKLNEALKDHSELLIMDIDDLMRELNKIPEDLKTAVKNNGGGHANHSLFWSIMRPGGGGEPFGPLAEEINRNFGDFVTFKDLFSKTALGRFGSGWAWLTNNNGKLEVMDTANQESPLSQGMKPLLALDVWEHAYYLKYQNKRNEYIENWWNVVNWDEVARRFEDSVHH